MSTRKENMITIKISERNSDQNEDALTKKSWVGLTEEEKVFIAGIAKITEPNDEPIKFGQPTRKCLQVLFDLAEAKLKEKNK